MEKELLSTQIALVNDLHNITFLENTLNQMQPLIKKYVRKLYFMEREDASQELNLSLIEAMYHIKSYKNNAMFLAYLHKSVINKYYYLCKQNIKRSTLVNEYTEIPDTIPYIENYSNIEFLIDINKLLKNKTKNEKIIAKYFLVDDIGDREIALKMGLSRQYVNRAKRKLLKEMFTLEHV